jgi:hypothetical protein
MPEFLRQALKPKNREFKVSPSADRRGSVRRPATAAKS